MGRKNDEMNKERDRFLFSTKNIESIVYLRSCLIRVSIIVSPRELGLWKLEKF